MKHLYNNAIDSISLGIEDYKSSDQRRIYSSTRNLVSGVLLLIKYLITTKVADEYKETVLQADFRLSVDKNGRVEFVHKSRRTLNVQEIKGRCNELGITVDWAALGRIVEFRNSIEHYYYNGSNSSITEMLANTFIILYRILVEELKEKPEEVFDGDIWNTLIEQEQIFTTERDRFRRTIVGYDWGYDALNSSVEEATCPHCGSELVKLTNPECDRESLIVECLVCGEQSSFELFVEHVLNDYFRCESYLSLTDGGDPPLGDCPFCFNHTYCSDENVCVICGESATRTCESCGDPISIDDLADSSYCSYCRHRFDND